MASILLDHQCSSKIADSEGKTPLHYIKDFEVTETVNIVTLLLQLGADMNAQDKDGDTPLHAAIKRAQCGSNKTVNDAQKIIRALRKNGASLDIRNNNGYKPAELEMSADTRKALQ